MIGKIAAAVLGISCAGLVVSGAAERLSPHTRMEVDHVQQAYADQFEASGTYIFEESGTVLGKVPWSAHVELELERDGDYELRVQTEADGDIDVDAHRGRYRIEGDRLVLLDEQGNVSDFDRLRIDGDRITLDADWPAVLALKAVGVGDPALEKKISVDASVK